MSELLTLQTQFVRMVARLIDYATREGYDLTFGDAYAKSGHREKSNHYIRLAIDLNLFREGVWLKNTDDHEKLGKFWESIGGSWGGRYSDGNHYSVKYMGRE